MSSPSPTDPQAERQSFWVRAAENWPNVAGEFQSAVSSALATMNGDLNLTWKKDNQRPPQSITVDDLAAALWVVSTNENTVHYVPHRYRKRGKDRIAYRAKERDRWGLSLRQLTFAVRAATGKFCHRAKATKLLALLCELRLIEKTANYVTRKRGNVYRVCRDRPLFTREMDADLLAVVEELGPLIQRIPALGAFFEIYAKAVSAIARSIGSIEETQHEHCLTSAMNFRNLSS